MNRCCTLLQCGHNPCDLNQHLFIAEKHKMIVNSTVADGLKEHVSVI